MLSNVTMMAANGMASTARTTRSSAVMSGDPPLRAAVQVPVARTNRNRSRERALDREPDHLPKQAQGPFEPSPRFRVRLNSKKAPRRSAAPINPTS